MTLSPVRLPSALLALVLAAGPAGSRAADPPIDTSPPASPVKLVFVHHSTGENWLADGGGGLGLALRDARWFVSDTNYGWGPEDPDAGAPIGDLTDLGHWWTWFAGPRRDTYLSALLAESGQHSEYARLSSDPGGPNRVVMFKSCFPNSQLGGSPSDPVPRIASNPLRGQDSGSEHHTLANAKGIYVALRDTFAARPDILFVVVTAPPLVPVGTDLAAAANARALSDWLVKEWLAGYPQRNVLVFDFFNVLTSNGGSTRTNEPGVNDLGWADGNHHRVRGGVAEHLRTVANDRSAYGSAPDDSHPTGAGGLKATGELVPLLNAAWHCWQGTAGCPMSTPPPACTVGCDAVVPATAEAGVAVGLRALAVPKGCVGEPSFEWDFGDGSASGAGESVTHTWPAGTFTWKVTVTVGTGSCSKSGTIVVTGGGGGGDAWVAVVPAVSHAPGDKGSLWRTDVAVVNPGASAASLTVTFVPVAGASVTRTAALGAGGTREWADVLVSLFGVAAAANVSGAVRVASDVPLCVASRTFNQDALGTFGGFLPAVTAGEALAPGKTGVLPQLARNSLFRTNVGVTNLATAQVSATIRLFSESGAAVGAPIPVTVPPGGLHQVVDPFGVAGAGDRDVAFATVEVTTPGGLAWAYASVIDNRTGDPTIVPVEVP
ncbi:MAG: PKD domain-containing protein [Thermoanaerobaculia bacterium]|nr:PKD domain-containing protein [Thermoanaerobaculia bacterium]